MEILKKLKEQGWYLTEDGLRKIPGETDPKKIISLALNLDFREIGGGALSNNISKKEESIPGKIVLQVQKIRNISAPKANEESKTAPRFLQIDFSDGITLVQALEFEFTSVLSLNTPPGTKVFFKCHQIPLMNGMIVLNPADLEVLGGKVTPLVEKWEVTRSLQKYVKSGRIQSGTSGPPPWIPFGQQVQGMTGLANNFKNVSLNEKDKEAKENNEFNTMRSEAIAEASKTGAKKVFGGGNHHIIDHNVKKILEKGFTEEDAKIALRATGNSLERALYNLKRRGDSLKSRDEFREKSKIVIGGRKGIRDIGKRGKDTEDGSAKPITNMSLFDFLTDKLPTSFDQTQSSIRSTISTDSFPAGRKRHDMDETSDRSRNSYSLDHPIHNYQERRQYLDKTTNAKTYQDNIPSVSGRQKFENNLSSSFATRNNNQLSDYQANRRGGSYGRSDNNNFPGKQNRDYIDKTRQTYNAGRNVRNPSEGNFMEKKSSNANKEQSEYYDSRSNKRCNGPEVSEQPDYTPARKSENISKKIQERELPKESYDSHHNKTGNDRFQTTSRQNAYKSNPNNNISTKTNISFVNNNSSKHSTSTNQNKEATKQKGLKQNFSQSSNSQLHELVLETKLNQQQPLINSATQKLQQTFGPLPNGYNYDPNKIIGFQSKETNEFALSLLKSQGISTEPPLTQSGVSPVPVAMPAPQYVPAPGHSNTLQMNHQPFATSPFMVQQMPQTGQPVPATFGMMPGDTWNWKRGDLCFAKYWDDGRYYEAEITGISDTTCVVLFLGYGNHEEVLKTDCLPITDIHHRTVNLSNNVQRSTPMNITPQISTINRGVPNRCRTERQVYVPPPKRDN